MRGEKIVQIAVRVTRPGKEPLTVFLRMRESVAAIFPRTVAAVGTETDGKGDER